MTRCKGNITSTCGKKVNAKCVDYEGEYHDRTGFEECDKPSLEDVVEDINETLNFLSESVDLSQLPQACDAIDYNQDGDELLVSEALIAHSEMLCALIEHTGYGEAEPCPDCNDPCGNSTPSSSCCTPLVYYTYGSGEDVVTTANYPAWSPLQTPGYSTLTYTTTEAGVFKITLDIGCTAEPGAPNALIGISRNGVEPVNSPFSRYELMPDFNSRTFHFVLTNVVIGEELGFMVLGTPGANAMIDGVKMLIEKVG